MLLHKLNEGQGGVTVDSSDQSNDGTITGANWTTGKYGYGLNFDGINDQVDVPYSPSLDLDGSLGFCIEAWVKLESDGSQWIAEKLDAYYLGAEPHGASKVRFKGGVWNGGVLQEVTSWAMGVGTWMHVAFQRNQAGYLSMVVGGIEQTVSGSACNPPDVNGNNLLVGCGVAGNYLQGELDELRMSNCYRDISSLDPNL